MEHKKERRRLGLAILVSLVLHLVIAYSLAAFGSVFTPVPSAEDGPSELTIIDLSATPPPVVPTNPPFMQTAPAKESIEKPKEQTFESNANSKAASELPTAGDIPLPSQDGKERPFVNLETHQYSLPTEGSTPQPQAQPSVAKANPTPVAPTPPKPRASEAPKLTPPPAPPATPEPEQFAMLTSTPPPPIAAPEETEPPRDVTTSLAPQVPRPNPEQPASDYQSQKIQTKISGRITDRGPSAVNAVGTPMGRYQKVVYDAIGSRWYYYTKQKADLISIGTAQLRFSIDRSGRVENLKVAENTSNESFANVCLQSVTEAKIPPIPEEISRVLPSEGLTMDLTFTMFGN